MKHTARKVLALLLCLAMCLSLLPAATVSAASDDVIRVACVGDSITYGHNPADGGRTQIKNNWPTVLGQLLGDSYDVRNFGQNGITLMKSGGTPVWSTNVFTQSKEFQPDIVIIMLGTNDSPPAENWNKGEAFKADYEELIETYRALDSAPEVYVATCATAFNDGGFSLPPSSIHNNIVPLQKEIAEEMDCPLLDVHEATAELGDLFPDNIHPNEAGHKAIAEYIYSVLSAEDEDDDDPGIPIYEDTSYSFDERAADLIARMTLQQKASQLLEGAAAIPASALGGGTLHTTATKGLARYSWWAESLHGLLRDNMSPQSEGTKDNVSYAQSLTMASTWNPELYYEGAVAIADEIRERSITNELGNCLNLNFYSPTINMQRDPRWGRNEESYSEDVYLTSVMGTQYVLGMEGKDQDGNIIDPSGYYKTHTTIKHYTANNTEAIRTSGGATSDLRALREYYTAPYRGVIEGADPSSVMTAYSSFNGEPCSYSSYLMDTLLRQTFGFSGYITSDCDSAKTISNLNYTNPRTGKKLTGVEQMAGALAHGEDLECNSGISASVGDYSAQATAMVSGNVQTDKGTFTENSIDVSVHRLMSARIATGELDENNPYTIAANERKAEQKANGTNNYTQERIDIVDQEVEEGVVMLKNEDDLLPLKIPASGEYKVVIVGSWQTDMYLGLYSSEQRHAEDDKWRINIQKGITNAIKEVNPDATFTYITSTSLTSANEEAIKAADAAIVVTGTGSGYSAEGRDRSNTALPNNQATLISNVGKLNPNTVAVMETCGPMEVKTFESNVKAILWSSFGGIRKGVGFGKVITGAVNPSGHLTATWYYDDSDIPGIRDYNLYATNGSSGRTYMYYVGKNDPSYVFGYGLSYTTFAYSNLKIDKTSYDANDTVKVSFDVKNTGTVEGKEVTQLYIAQPDAPAELNRPIRRLEGFEKVNLKPGETKTITMEVSIPDLVYYDEETDCYAVDTGKYQVQVGEDSAHANLTKDFTVTGEMDVYPELLTVKANQTGDDALGIEERIIFDKGVTVNPQLTVCMNNEKLYGYIIKEQTSIIKSLESCDLPEGMTFTYESNRPDVVKVEDGVIKTVGAGVATITATGELDGHVVTDDFVVYVMVEAKATSITVDGEPLAKFSPEKLSYRMTLESRAHIPQVAATALEGLKVKVTQAKSLPGTATIVVTDPDAKVSETYTIDFKVKATGGASTAIDFTNPADASKFDIANQATAEIAEGTGLKLTATRPAFETCNGRNEGDQATTPEDVVIVPVSGDFTATLEFDFSQASARNGYYQFFGFYAGEGEDYQNLAGVRGGDGAMQDFLRVDGNITADTDGLKSSPGLASDGTYWYRIIKEADTYIVSRSSDGDEFTDMFTYEATGFEADKLIIDAYTGMTEGYEFTLKSLVVEGEGGGLPSIDFTSEADAGKYDYINQATAELVEGEGVTLTATRPAFETCNGRNSDEQATVPEDVVAVPVSGDWSAVLEFDFSQASARNGYYQFFGFYASEGEDYQNLAGIRGGDGALQDFLRVDGNITADTDGLKSSPGLASDGTYWFKITKEGTTYICARSSDGDEFTDIFSYEDTGIEADQILIDAYTGMTEGYQFTLKSLTFEGGGGTVVKEKPEIASITVNGEEFGFDAGTKVYNFEVAKDSTKAPVIAATAANKSTKIDIQQLDGPFGTAYVTASVDNKSVTYSLSFNYGPQDDYFADGDMSENWEILHEVKEATEERPWTYYRLEEGTGLVMPTQKGSIYMAKQADPQGPWTNVFLTPAQGNWEVIIKAFYPELPKDIYQQTQVFAWQDEDHYIRINCQYNAQQNLRVEPANEVGSGTFNILDVTYAKANDDGTATLYYKINKNGTTYTVSYSTDCKNWVAGGSVSGLDYVDPKIGIFCTQDDSNDNYIELAFEYLAVTSLNGIEQKNGVEVLNWAAQNAADYMAAGLPEKTDENLSVKAPHGYTVEFVSSNPAVIAADGTVTPGKENTSVQVAVKVTEGDTTATSETVTVQVVGSASGECVHNYVAVKTEATCTAKGYTTYTCSKCKDSYTADEVAALGHDYKAVKTEATCTKDGYTTYTCSRCKDTYKGDEVKALGHDYKAVKTEPTCTAKGYTTYTCSKCKDTYTADEVAALGHDFKDGKCTRCGADDPDYKPDEPKECPSAVFTDAPKKGNWAHEGIDYCVANKYMNGMTATTFAPGGTVTRGQLVTILYRMAGSPEVTFKGTFTDVKDGKYYSKAVEWAAANGIVNGITATTFQPDTAITREQIATILYRYSKSPAVEGDLSAYPDAAKAGNYAKNALVWATKEGLINGVKSGDKTELQPKANATRAQIAAIIMRFQKGEYKCD